jgi:hypothetical protein
MVIGKNLKTGLGCSIDEGSRWVYLKKKKKKKKKQKPEQTKSIKIKLEMSLTKISSLRTFEGA